jgi:hypothetical protein
MTNPHAFPMRTEQVMTVTFDLLMFVGLLTFRRAMPAPLLWIALRRRPFCCSRCVCLVTAG